MKIRINPAYKHLTSFVENFLSLSPEEGKLIFKGRNEIRSFHVHGEQVVVKSFKIPHFINRIAYSFFKSSKAQRSYEHSLKLMEKEINIPIPIAYAEEKRKALFSASYYVSTYIDYSGIMRELAFYPLNEVEDLVEAFALFTAHLHDKEILHLDYSPGNILYKKTDDTYSFCLIDINRMKFGPVDWKTGCHNLRRLWGSDETIAYIAQKYAEARAFDPEKTVEQVLKNHAGFWIKYAKKYNGAKPYHPRII